MEKWQCLTRPSSGRAKAGFASFVPPLKYNVRAHEPAGQCHAFARVLVDAVNRRVPRQAQVTGAMNAKGLAPAKLGMQASARAARPLAVSGRAA